MSKEAQSLAALFQRQAQLQGTQNSIAQELVLINQKILFLLAGHSRTAAAELGGSAIEVGVKAKGKASGSQRVRKSWFERGEVSTLLLKVARSAMRPADAVRGVLAAKGLDSASKEDQKKAAAVVYQAIIANVKAGRLTRDRSGKVVTK